MPSGEMEKDLGWYNESCVGEQCFSLLFITLRLQDDTGGMNCFHGHRDGRSSFRINLLTSLAY
jgi:hypothetical protein